MPKANVNGINLHYETRGQGFPIVFVHEYAGSWESWNSQVEFFSRSYSTVAYNARGYPPSDVPPTPTPTPSSMPSTTSTVSYAIWISRRPTFVASLWVATSLYISPSSIPQWPRGIVVAGTGSGSTDSSRWGHQIDDLAARMETQGMDSMAFYTRTQTRTQLLRKDPRRLGGVQPTLPIPLRHRLRPHLPRRPGQKTLDFRPR